MRRERGPKGRGVRGVYYPGYKAKDGTLPDRLHIVYVGANTLWSNPFIPGKAIGGNKRGETYAHCARLDPDAKVEDAQHAYDLYVAWLELCRPYTWAQLRSLAHASAFACWCPFKDPCHADHLADVLAKAESAGLLR